MKKILLALGSCVLPLSMSLVSVSASADEVVNAADHNGGLNSLRSTELNQEVAPDRFKKIHKDRDTIERDYLHQPPLIPHQVRDYRVDTNSNKCLSCHSWNNYKKSGATKVSLTHFDTRDGQQLTDVSPRRYFCLQCHAPQADAKPLVKNYFKAQ